MVENSGKNCRMAMKAKKLQHGVSWGVEGGSAGGGDVHIGYSPELLEEVSG